MLPCGPPWACLVELIVADAHGLCVHAAPPPLINGDGPMMRSSVASFRGL